jgi:hypothetical protein
VGAVPVKRTLQLVYCCEARRLCSLGKPLRVVEHPRGELRHWERQHACCRPNHQCSRGESFTCCSNTGGAGGVGPSEEAGRSRSSSMRAVSCVEVSITGAASARCHSSSIAHGSHLGHRRSPMSALRELDHPNFGQQSSNAEVLTRACNRLQRVHSHRRTAACDDLTNELGSLHAQAYTPRVGLAATEAQNPVRRKPKDPTRPPRPPPSASRADTPPPPPPPVQTSPRRTW